MICHKKCQPVIIKGFISPRGFLTIGKEFFGLYTEHENFIRLAELVERTPCEIEVEATINPLGEICYRGKVVGYENSTPFTIA